MKKLLYITNAIKGPAGLERVLSVKASYLAEHFSYDVHIVVLNNNGEKPFYHFSPKITVHDISVKGNPAKYLKSYISGMRRVVDLVKPDFISVCDDGLKGFFLSIILGKPCPMVYERHVSKIIALGPNPNFRKRLKTSAKFSLMNFLGSKFDKFVVLTDGNRAEWDLGNLAVISNPLPFFPRESAGLENKTVIAVGKQSYQKGFDRLLRAWKNVSKKYPDWKIEIYGKSDPAQKLPELTAELGISQSVNFFEPVKNIDEKFLQSSIFVLSSRFEGFGMVIIEAMACGVPCVSFDCPFGPSDIISDGEDGYLAPNGDIAAMSEKIELLIADEIQRKAMGALARNNVRRFLPEVIIPQWDNLFKSIAR